MLQPPSADTVAAHLGVGQRFLPGQDPMVAPVAWQLDVWSLQSIHWQGHASATALFLAVSTSVNLRPSATWSSQARLQPQSLIGYAAFGKL